MRCFLQNYQTAHAPRGGPVPVCRSKVRSSCLSPAARFRWTQHCRAGWPIKVFRFPGPLRPPQVWLERGAKAKEAGFAPASSKARPKGIALRRRPGRLRGGVCSRQQGRGAISGPRAGKLQRLAFRWAGKTMENATRQGREAQRSLAFSLPTIFSKRLRCSGVRVRKMRFLPSARKSSIWPWRFW